VMFTVTEDLVTEWTEAYPAVDVRQHLRNYLQWTKSNPQRRKTRKGIRKSITTWLAKEQDRGGSRRPPSTVLEANQAAAAEFIASGTN